MGDCRELAEMLSDYIDGELDKELCSELEAHLKGCKNCRLVFDSMKMTVRLCRNGVCEDLPAQFQEKFQQKMAKRWKKNFGKT
ncbi:MAG: zf-HC2 domain-containing protein [candidate division Zixibacteria bacterium]